MKICRFNDNRLGLVADDGVRDVSGALAKLPSASYPFPRHDSLLWFSWVVLLTVITISITVFVQMNRDRIISMLSGTEPGRFNLDSVLVGHVVTYAVVPIMVLLGAQFPHALGGIFSWFGGLFSGQK